MGTTIGDVRHALYVAPTHTSGVEEEYEDFTYTLKHIGVEIDFERLTSGSLSISMGKDSYEESLSYIAQYDLIVANIDSPSEYIGQRAQVANSLGKMLVTTHRHLTSPSRMVLGASNLRLSNTSSKENASSLTDYLRENSKRLLPNAPQTRQLDLSDIQNIDPLEFALQKATPLAYVAFPITNAQEDERNRIRTLVKRIGILLKDLEIEVRDLEHKLTDPATERGRTASIANIHQSNHAEIARADFVILMTSEEVGSIGVGMEHAIASYEGKPQIHVGTVNDRLTPIFPTRWVSHQIDCGNDDGNFEALANLLRDYRSTSSVPTRWKFANRLDRCITLLGLSHRDLAREMELKYGKPLPGFSVSNLSKLTNPKNYKANLPPIESLTKFCEILTALGLDPSLAQELYNAGLELR